MLLVGYDSTVTAIIRTGSLLRLDCANHSVKSPLSLPGDNLGGLLLGAVWYDRKRNWCGCTNAHHSGRRYRWVWQSTYYRYRCSGKQVLLPVWVAWVWTSTSVAEVLQLSTLLACSFEALGCELRFPDSIGGSLPGVHYIRNVADADSLVSALVCHMHLCCVH